MARSGALSFVHAHPDDEALFTAGTIRHYVDLGVRTLLVTCTDGRLGLDDQFLAGSDSNHHSDLTKITRAAELAQSVGLLAVARHVTLGYGDSGLTGWPQNADPSSFVNASVESVARTVAALFDEEQVRVAVTYDENGYYGHPDHIHAHLITRRAVELSATVERLYYPVTPRSVLDAFVPAAQERGVFLPLWVRDAGQGIADDAVDVTIDARAWAEVKRSSIAAHASQVDNADLVTMDEDLFRLLFGREYFVLGWSREISTGTPDDLFGGLQ